jgi:DNA replication protein DnaC
MTQARARTDAAKCPPEEDAGTRWRRSIALSRLVGVPGRVRRALEELVETRATREVRDWMAGRSWCLVLCAPPGTGKSVAAGLWLAQLMPGVDTSRALVRRWWSATEISRLNYYGPEFSALETASALVLDDLGAEYTDARGHFETRLDGLIDARYREGRRTLITTNLKADALQNRYGKRVFDRLRHGVSWAIWNAASMRGG